MRRLADDLAAKQLAVQRLMNELEGRGDARDAPPAGARAMDSVTASLAAAGRALLPGGAEEQSGAVAPGDQLVAIDGDAVFDATKRKYWRDVLEATTTHTPPPRCKRTPSQVYTTSFFLQR